MKRMLFGGGSFGWEQYPRSKQGWIVYAALLVIYVMVVAININISNKFDIDTFALRLIPQIVVIHCLYFWISVHFGERSIYRFFGKQIDKKISKVIAFIYLIISFALLLIALPLFYRTSGISGAVLLIISFLIYIGVLIRYSIVQKY